MSSIRCLMRYILLTLFWVISVSPSFVQAGNRCQNVVVQKQVFQDPRFLNQQLAVSNAQQVVTAVPAAVYGQVAFQAPSYSWSYNQGAQAVQTANTHEDKLDQILKKLDLILANCSTGVSAEAQEVNHAVALMKTKCASCHTGSTGLEKSGLELFDEDGKVLEKLPRMRIWGSVNHDPGFHAMPKGQEKLNSQELEILKAWVVPATELEY